MATSPPITSFSCLTFDCYGTLVDWEGGIYKALSPLTSPLPPSHPLSNDRPATLKAFARLEGEVQRAQPRLPYHAVLSETYDRLAAELGAEASDADKTRFGASVGDWPAFPDTVDALKRLRKHFKLVILSNVDGDSFQQTLARQLPGVAFDAVYTAQDIGSYKPDTRNFDHLIEHCESHLRVRKDAILHTAQSLRHDHVPAAKMGLASAWIERGVQVESVMGGRLEDFRDDVFLSWHFRSLGEMADAVDAAVATSA